MTRSATTAHVFGIALVAASVLAYEIVLMRTFAIESYASFGGMVISIALLGFGLSGTLLTVFREPLLARIDGLLYGSALAFLPLVVGAHFLNQQIPFVPGKMLAEPSHAWWIAALYATALVPLFAASVYIGVTLVGFTRDVHRLYFADLAASGVGAFAVLGLLYVVPPAYLMLIPLVPAGLGAVAVARTHAARAAAVAVLAVCVAAVVAYGEVRFNEFKGILGTLRTAEVSGARVVAERFGPMGYLQVVASSSERTAPGLSAATPLGISPPEQHALFVDGEKVSSLARDLPPKQAAYLDWLISALPYTLVPKPRVLALGVAGGEELAEALHHGARQVVGVAGNPQLVDLLREFGDYNGRLLERPGVEVRIGEGRAVAEATGEEYDLVMLRGLDASGLSVAATPGSTETYLLTVEAFQAYFRALAPGGIVAVTMRLSVPPYKAIRLIPTVAAALRAAGHGDVGRRVAFVRDTFVGLCLVRPDGFGDADVDAIRTFARAKSFDVSWVPGLRDDETNQYTVLLDEAYTRVARAVLEGGDEGRSVLDAYLFDIGPTTDDRPYFADVVKRGSIAGLQDYQRRSVEAAEAVPSGDPGGDVPDLDGGPEGDPGPDGGQADEPAAANAPTAAEEAAGDQAQAEAEADDAGLLGTLRHLPVELWSAYMQWATLAQAALFGALIILVPVFFSRRGIRGVPGKGRALVYFACLGLGFMLAEIVLIRKLTLFLASPLYATTVVLAAILLFSGIGSLFAGRYPSRERAIAVAAAGIVLSLLFWMTLADPLFRALLGLPALVRILIAVTFIAPVAFFLGFPFPTGLSALDTDATRPLVPWAWGINGATSVVAAILADIGSTNLGFRVVLGIAAVLYALAWAVFPGRAPAAARG